MEQTVWGNSELGISFSVSSGRITIFRTTMAALEHPPYFRFLLDMEHRQFAIEQCGFQSNGSHQFSIEQIRNGLEIKCMSMVRFIYQTCGWNKDLTYRVRGELVSERRIIVFDLTTAISVSEGRLID